MKKLAVMLHLKAVKNFCMLFIIGFVIVIENAKAQESTSAPENVVKAAPAGFVVETPYRAGYLFVAGFEHCFSSSLSVQGDIGYDGVIRGGIIKPSLKYYLTGEAPKGIHVGGYFSTSFRSGGAVIALGGQAGYQHLFLDNQLAVFGDLGAGIGFYTFGGSTAGFNMQFSVGAGYAF